MPRPELAELLTRCPGLAAHAASRTVLGVQAYPVPPLPVPETTDLPLAIELDAAREQLIDPVTVLSRLSEPMEDV